MTVPGYDDLATGIWLPSTGQDQSCAFCGDDGVPWVHPLAPDRVGYRRYGRSITLPTFWTVCGRCEQFVADGADDHLLRVMRGNDGWPWTSEADVEEDLAQALAAFRRADLGARGLPRSGGIN